MAAVGEMNGMLGERKIDITFMIQSELVCLL